MHLLPQLPALASIKYTKVFSLLSLNAITLIAGPQTYLYNIIDITFASVFRQPGKCAAVSQALQNTIAR